MTTLTREQWTEQCASRFIECGVSKNDARQIAESLAESHVEFEGDEIANWRRPRDAANDEMSYWGD